MLILTSPAKSLNEDPDWDKISLSPTQPRFVSNSNEIINRLKKLSKKELKKILGVSDKLLDLNESRYKSWSSSHTNRNSKPAILMFDGDIYKRIPAHTYSKKQMQFMQQSLRIISGLYGLIRPYDLIQPYRLEMSTTLKINQAENLYDFWGDKLTESLNQEIKQDNHKLLVNLASQEYSRAVNLNNLTCEYIEVEFLQKRDGKLKNIGILSKFARGMMIDFIVENSARTVADLKKFKKEDYKFHSLTGHTISFVR